MDGKNSEIKKVGVKNQHAGHRERMREKFVKGGIDIFSDHEILEFLLYYCHAQKNTNPIAHDLIDHFQSLNAVFDASIDELSEVKNVKGRTATLIAFITQLIRRLEVDRIGKRIVLNNTFAVGDYCCSVLGLNQNEKLIMLSLDSCNRLIATDFISEGSSNEVLVDIQKILRCAILRKAHCVILAHNHPGGFLNPSPEDIDATNKVGQLLDILGITLLDHILCFYKSFSSLAERKLLDY